MRLKKAGGWLLSHINTLRHCKLFTRHMETGQAPRWGTLIRSLMTLPWPRFLGAGRGLWRGAERGCFLWLSIPLRRSLQGALSSLGLVKTPRLSPRALFRAQPLSLALCFRRDNLSLFSAPFPSPDLCLTCSLPCLGSLLFLGIL